MRAYVKINFRCWGRIRTWTKASARLGCFPAGVHIPSCRASSEYETYAPTHDRLKTVPAAPLSPVQTASHSISWHLEKNRTPPRSTTALDMRPSHARTTFRDRTKFVKHLVRTDAGDLRRHATSSRPRAPTQRAPSPPDPKEKNQPASPTSFQTALQRSPLAKNSKI